MQSVDIFVVELLFIKIKQKCFGLYGATVSKFKWEYIVRSILRDRERETERETDRDRQKCQPEGEIVQGEQEWGAPTLHGMHSLWVPHYYRPSTAEAQSTCLRSTVPHEHPQVTWAAQSLTTTSMWTHAADDKYIAVWRYVATKSKCLCSKCYPSN